METVKETFKNLKAKWKSETMYKSVGLFENENYKKIIELGKDVIPLIISDLKIKPEHWFYALQKITGENPVSEYYAGYMYAMATIWVNWYENQKEA